MLPPDPLPPAAHALICAALRGEIAAWPWGDDAEATAELLRQAEVHGVLPLLHGCEGRGGWPPALLDQLRSHAIQWAMWELGHQRVLSQTLAALAAIGVQPVLIKGTALAYSLYPDPALRSRGDTDLIIPIEEKERVHQVLAGLGFDRRLGMTGEFVSYQASYTRDDPMSGSHTLDLHWKINNSELLSRLFTYDELRRDAQPLPRLCPQALATSPVHALLLACMHRATHRQNPYYVGGEAHHDADRLIWLYDIHLLAGALNDVEWERVASLARDKGLGAVCLEGMLRATECFGTPYPGPVTTVLSDSTGAEAAARYLDGGKLRQQWLDFLALGDFSRRLTFLREVAFPPPGYMRARYPEAESSPLARLYLKRAVAGLARQVFRGSDTALRGNTGR